MAKLPECSEYLTVIVTPQLLKAEVLQNGHVIKHNETVIRYVGGFCIVFPYQTTKQKYAIRCWHANVANIQERTKRIAETLHQTQLPYFVRFDYVPEAIVTNEGLQPIVVMDWIEAKTLKEYIADNLHERSVLKKLATNFLNMVKEMHTNLLSHGDLQHGNILVKEDGNLVLVDYDSMYVPSLDGFTDDIKGLEGYQHVSRWNNRLLTPKADYFSELVIYTSIIALSKIPQLWYDLNIEDTETLLFSAEDIKSGGTTDIFKILDTDSELSLLSNSLKEFMHCNSINELKPLEDILVSPIDSISSKWEDNGYKKQVIDNSSIINSIGNAWNKAVHVKENKLPDTETITNKW